MKRILCLLLILCLCLGMLAACGAPQETTPTAETEPSVSATPTEGPMFTEDPAEDGILNILMIGNSFCYYYPDELWGMLEAAGIKARICNVYASGCKIEEHWDWWIRDIANYEIYATYDENGRVINEWWTLEQCLQQQNWDIITLQEESACLFNSSAQDSFNSNRRCYSDLFGYLKTKFPQSAFYWHQVWSFQVGYNRENYPNYSLEDQVEQAARMKDLAKLVCKEFDLTNIPSGDAWQLVREGGYDNLCARLAIKNGEGDYYHEGDIGGGQYLNACVWFEVITGKSCVGNTWRPTEYHLDEDLIQILQNAAHQAVANRVAE